MMELDDFASNAVREFVEKFGQVHQKNVLQARVMIVSAFIAGYSLSHPEDRLLILESILFLAKEIGAEIFEDGQDLVSLLNEKTEYIKKLNKTNVK